MRLARDSGKLVEEITQPVPAMAKEFQLQNLEARKRDDTENGGDDRPGDIVTERRTKEQVNTKKPPLYKCILHNDDYTTMEFVVEILNQVLHTAHAEPPRR